MELADLGGSPLPARAGFWAKFGGSGTSLSRSAAFPGAFTKLANSTRTLLLRLGPRNTEINPRHDCQRRG